MKTKKLPTAATIREAIHPHKPVVLPPDPEELNEDRADAAENAILAFAKDFGESIDFGMDGLEAQNLTDLLCDFGHYCDRNGIDLQNCLRMAASNYAEETENEGQQFNAGDPIDRMYGEAFAETAEGGQDADAVERGLKLAIAHHAKETLRITEVPQESVADKEDDGLNAKYREAAVEKWASDGECEIDDGAEVSRGDDPGAYVQAWVWVTNHEAGIPELESEAKGD